MATTRKTATKKTTRKPMVKVEIQPPEIVEQSTPFAFLGREDIEQLLGKEQAEEVATLVKKFNTRYNCKLVYVHKFRAFKIFVNAKHVDWIDLNELMKRYDCRIAPVKIPLQKAQRPYDKTRQVY